MNDYQKDAYVCSLPKDFQAPFTHGVVVDIVEEDGSIRHQCIAFQFGENNAKGDADSLNLWRDQTGSKD